MLEINRLDKWSTELEAAIAILKKNKMERKIV